MRKTFVIVILAALQIAALMVDVHSLWLWRISLTAEFLLLVRLCISPQVRSLPLKGKWFQALIAVDYLGGVIQRVTDHLGYPGLSGRIWLVTVALTAPLMALALIEAGSCWTVLQRLQRALLCWWVGIGYALVTMRAVLDPNVPLLCVNTAAFVGFLIISIEEARKERSL